MASMIITPKPQLHSAITARVRELILLLEIYEPEGMKRPTRAGCDGQVCLGIVTWQQLALAIAQYEIKKPKAPVTFFDLPRADILEVKKLVLYGASAKGSTILHPRSYLEQVKQQLILLHPPGTYPNVRGSVKGSQTSADAASLSAEAKPQQRAQVRQHIFRCGDYGANRDECVAEFEQRR